MMPARCAVIAMCLLTLAVPTLTFAQHVPPASLSVRRDVCPFECCTYRDWVARNVITAYRVPRDTVTTAFTVAPGETFEGLTGNVYIDRFGEVDVLRRTPAVPTYDEATWFNPGDTLYLLNYLGEGFQNVFYRDTIVTVEMFWWSPSDTAGAAAVDIGGVLRVEPAVEWWAEVRNAAGLVGWIDMSKARMSGIDACG